MPTQVQTRRGTTAQHSSFTGAAGELTVDTDKKTVVVHDGSTAGGTPLAKEAALSGYATNYTITTTAVSKTLANRERCTVTAAAQTITLPASPSAGNEVTITIDGTFTNTVVARNGSNIMSLAENMTVDKANVSVTFYYVDATRGWRII